MLTAKRSCFGTETGLSKLARTLSDRKRNPVLGSYANRLFNDTDLLNSKLREEIEELIEAKTKDEVLWEASDVIYFTLVRAISQGNYLPSYAPNFCEVLHYARFPTTSTSGH
jgi:phosphoribosyl-ATP pyrophosphohydrolase/phosphoribosyl-AMP cyclohydrolase/histidinol dehydrogenase